MLRALILLTRKCHNIIKHSFNENIKELLKLKCSSFSTLRIFHSPHFPHSAFSTLLIFHTPHFPHSTLSTLRTFHTPHFPHSALSTLLIFHTPHFPHSSFSTLRTPHPTFSTKPFVSRSIRLLKTNKTFGLDKISARLLKDSVDVITPSLKNLQINIKILLTIYMNVNFNKMLETLIFQRSYAQYLYQIHVP